MLPQQSFILRGVSILKHPFWKTTISQKHHSLSAAPAKRPPHLRGCACLWTDAVLAMMAMQLGRGLLTYSVYRYIYIIYVPSYKIITYMIIGLYVYRSFMTP